VTPIPPKGNAGVNEERSLIKPEEKEGGSLPSRLQEEKLLEVAAGGSSKYSSTDNWSQPEKEGGRTWLPRLRKTGMVTRSLKRTPKRLKG